MTIDDLAKIVKDGFNMMGKRLDLTNDIAELKKRLSELEKIAAEK